MKDLVAAMHLFALEVMRDDHGVTAIEYGLLAALIAVACIGAFTATGGSLTALYEVWTTAVVNAMS